MHTGVLLLNLGTPEAPTPAAVRRYLRQFLGDPRVLDGPAWRRWLVRELAILPLRSFRSAAAYRKVWGADGSPLLVHGRALREALAQRLGPEYAVELGMRYGTPALEDALERLAAGAPRRIVVFPLFPQYAGASSGSALERVFTVAGARWNAPALSVVAPFYDDAGFIGALAAVARPALERFGPDHLLLSYHGLPEHQVRRSDPGGAHCLVRAGCCDAIVPANSACYRAHCFATSRALAAALDLRPSAHGTAFQSRLGRAPWIRPWTDQVLPELAARGVKRLAVLCPSFVADCLETLEEIGIRGREQWARAGGTDLLLVPCPNDHPAWVEAAAELVQRAR